MRRRLSREPITGGRGSCSGVPVHTVVVADARRERSMRPRASHDDGHRSADGVEGSSARSSRHPQRAIAHHGGHGERRPGRLEVH